jgi:hypothetical protein
LRTCSNGQPLLGLPFFLCPFFFALFSLPIFLCPFFFALFFWRPRRTHLDERLFLEAARTWRRPQVSQDKLNEFSLPFFLCPFFFAHFFWRPRRTTNDERRTSRALEVCGRRPRNFAALVVFGWRL